MYHSEVGCVLTVGKICSLRNSWQNRSGHQDDSFNVSNSSENLSYNRIEGKMVLGSFSVAKAKTARMSFPPVEASIAVQLSSCRGPRPLFGCLRENPMDGDDGSGISESIDTRRPRLLSEWLRESTGKNVFELLPCRNHIREPELTLVNDISNWN